MLRSLRELERYEVNATDGTIGSISDFFLDDDRWTIRYLVVETSGHLNQRRVLITPIFFRQIDWSTKQFHLALTIDKIRNSPNINLDRPVSRKHELDYYSYYGCGYPYYWSETGLWGVSAYPGACAIGKGYGMSVGIAHNASDIHLRSVNEVRGYGIQGIDERIGHVEDFIVDDESWEVRYLVVDTSSWWLGTKVLIAPRWATRVSWEGRNVGVNMNRPQIKDSPKWIQSAPINREYETRLHEHYGFSAHTDANGRVQAPVVQ